MIVRLNEQVSGFVRKMAHEAGVSCDEAANGIFEFVMGVKRSKQKKSRSVIPEIEKEMIRDLHENGVTYEELAKRWNVSVPTIRRACGSLR